MVVLILYQGLEYSGYTGGDCGTGGWIKSGWEYRGKERMKLIIEGKKRRKKKKAYSWFMRPISLRICRDSGFRWLLMWTAICRSLGGKRGCKEGWCDGDRCDENVIIPWQKIPPREVEKAFHTTWPNIVCQIEDEASSESDKKVEWYSNCHDNLTDDIRLAEEKASIKQDHRQKADKYFYTLSSFSQFTIEL